MDFQFVCVCLMIHGFQVCVCVGGWVGGCGCVCVLVCVNTSFYFPIAIDFYNVLDLFLIVSDPWITSTFPWVRAIQGGLTN